MSITRRSLGQHEPGLNPSVLLSRPAPPAANGDELIAPSRNEVAPPDEWTAQSAEGLVQTRSLLSVARGLVANAESGAYERLKPIPTGFDALDQWIGGGLRPGELVLLGGAQGVGKTTLCLQLARNVAARRDA